MIAFTDKTARYLERRGAGPDIIAALRNGETLGVTGDVFAGWIAGAFKDGQSHSRRSLSEALLPKLNELVSAAHLAGKGAGYEEAQAEVIEAETRIDRFSDELDALRPAKALATNVDEHQATVADCLLWFDGFAAAHAPKESWERPHLPNRERIRDLNKALQRIMRGKGDAGGGDYRALDDQDIPF